MMELTAQEQYLIKRARELQPYEALLIEGDKEGKIGRFILRSSQTIVVSEVGITPVRSGIRETV